MKNFTNFHEALHALNNLNFLEVGIIHTSPEIFYFFLETVELQKEHLFYVDSAGNTLLHLICRNSDIGIDVLQKMLLLIRSHFPADEVEFNRFVKMQNHQQIRAHDYCQQLKHKNFTNLMSKFYEK